MINHQSAAAGVGWCAMWYTYSIVVSSLHISHKRGNGSKTIIAFSEEASFDF